MYVVGTTSTTGQSAMRHSATSALSLPAFMDAPARDASNSTASWPTLCRVFAYCFPGLPRPTTMTRDESAVEGDRRIM